MAGQGSTCVRGAGLEAVHIWEEMAWEAAVGVTAAIEAAYQSEGDQVCASIWAP